MMKQELLHSVVYAPREWNTLRNDLCIFTPPRCYDSIALNPTYLSTILISFVPFEPTINLFSEIA